MAIYFDGINTVARAIHKIKRYLNMAVMPLTLQRLEMLHYKPPSGQSQAVTTQHLVQMFRECKGFAMTPEETLIIVMLNTITNKELMVKVNENLRDDMAWTDVRNIIIKLYRAAHLSDQYQNTNRMLASAAQNKSCRACGKSGHMTASCKVDKTKLNCTFSDLKGSHATNACIKKKKASKTKGKSEERNKTKSLPKDDPKPRRKQSNNSRIPPSASFRPRTSSQESRFKNL